MKKKVVLLLILILFLFISIFLYFFYKVNYKTSDLGNTNNKSLNDFEQYILNISSYESNVTVEVQSNKNSNKYQIKQTYSEPNLYKQEVIEPANIKGVITIYDGSSLTIKNTQLELNKIYENYQYISDNFLCLHQFAKAYEISQEKKIEEKNDNIVMEAKLNDSNNQYNQYQILYMDKKTGKPIKMEIQDINKNTVVYILYNEIKINSTSKEEVLAFELNLNQSDI